LTFVNADDYDKISEGDKVTLADMHSNVKTGKYTLKNDTTGVCIELECALSDRQIEIILAGGLIAATAKNK
jgi:aconitate hydratase